MFSGGEEDKWGLGRCSGSNKGAVEVLSSS